MIANTAFFRTKEWRCSWNEREGKDELGKEDGWACSSTHQACSCRRNQWLEQLWLADLLQEAQSGASNVLVGMLEVVPESIADEDHLLLEFPIFGVLGDCFKVEVEELYVFIEISALSPM